MNPKRGVSCLIPFYNEGERIAAVLEVVTQVSAIDQIVCVDDGSADDTFRMIRTKWPAITVLRLPQNEGKAGAISRGLERVENELVLLMDADLQDLNKRELEAAIRAMQENDQVDMLILRRVNAAWFVKMNRGDVLLSGERIMKKQDLKAILARPVNGFQLEMAINEYMQEHHKDVRWMPWSATNTYKMAKRGPVKGMIKDFRMYADIIQYAGVFSFARQIASFARKPINWR